MSGSRRRAFVLGGLALMLGGLAASDVAEREAALGRQVGAPVPVVVARTGIGGGEVIERGRLGVRMVPARFAPDGTFSEPAQVTGQRAAVTLAPGADITAATLDDPAAVPSGAPVDRGERVADVVASGPPDLVVAGARVDVLVTREQRPGRQAQTRLALEDVEVIAARGTTPADGGAARVAASLRVTLRQAVFLAAAQGFAREIRLLPRPRGDAATGHTGLAYGESLG